MTTALPSLVNACDCTGVSDRSAATIASAVLQGMKIIFPENQFKKSEKAKTRKK